MNSYNKRLIKRLKSKIENIVFIVKLIFEKRNKIGKRMKDNLFSSLERPNI
jgi:hypothetical protein